MEEKSNILNTLFFIISRKVKMQLKRKKKKKKICVMREESAVTDWTCQKFVKFPAGDFSLDDAPQLGRPAEVDSHQIETLTENKQHYTTREIANIPNISKASIENHLHLLGYVNCLMFGFHIS